MSTPERPADRLTPAETLANARDGLVTSTITTRVDTMTRDPSRLAQQQEICVKRQLEVRAKVRKAAQDRLEAPAGRGGTKTMQQALDEIAARTQDIDLHAIIARLTGVLPINPGPGETLQQPTGEGSPPIIIENPRAPRHAPEGYQPASIVHTDIRNIRRDQRIVAALLVTYGGNPEYNAALTALQSLLESYARTDVAAYAATQMYEQQQNSVTTRGLHTMGKLLAMAALGVYALVDGTIAIANKRMPLAGLVALGLAGVIGDARLRRQLLSSKDQIAAEEMIAVLSNPVFKDYLVPKYKIYAEGEQWAPIVETLIQKSKETNDFIEKIIKREAPPMTDEEKQNYLVSLGVGATTHSLHERLSKMITLQPGQKMTDFERLIKALQPAQSETAREAVVAAIRTDRGRRLQAGPILNTPPGPPAAPPAVPPTAPSPPVIVGTPPSSSTPTPGLDAG